MIEGEHDFSAFAASDEKDDLGRSKVRRVFHSRASRSGDLLIYSVRGSGFLKHMVRNIVGVLLEVGKGNLTRADIEKRLEPGVRDTAGAFGAGARIVSGQRGILISLTGTSVDLRERRSTDFDHPFRQFFPDVDAIGEPDQVGILEFHAGAGVAIVEQGVMSFGQQTLINFASRFEALRMHGRHHRR